MPATIVAHGLSKRFGRYVGLSNVELEVPSGEFLTIFGPNGAGKTTLIRCLSTLSRPTSGTVELLGQAVANATAGIRSRIGVVSHQSFLYGQLTARENLLFYARMFAVRDPETRVRAVANMVQLGDRLDDPVRTFSRGLIQRCSIARALVHQPEVLLFDEPFSGLDPLAATRLVELLRDAHAAGSTVIMASHDLRRGIELADRIAVLCRGRLVHIQQASTAEEFETTYYSLVSRD